MTKKLLRVLALALAAPPAVAGAAQPPNPVPVDGIAARWQQRQDAAKTFRLVWEQSILYPVGGYAEVHADSVGKGVVFPKTDTSFAEAGTLAVDDVKIRFDFRGQSYAPTKKQFVDNSYSAVYDGKTGLILRESGEPGVTAANKQAGRRPVRLVTAANLPTLWAFRPLAIGLGSDDLDLYQLSGRSSVLASVPCVELVLRSPPRGVSTSLWLAPGQDYHVVRHQQQFAEGEYSLMQYDVSYRADPAGRWVPSGWTYVRKARSGKVVSSTKAAVTECVVDGPVAPETFDLTPPKKSRVTEYDRGDRAESKYIIREDGSRREILPGEESLGFGKLAASEPGEPIGQPRPSWAARNWIPLVGVGTFVLGAAGFFYRRKRRPDPA